jgi:indole-3-glycerol phosphate synthase
LRKDFVVDIRDIYDAKIMGATAALLIVAALEDDQLCELFEAATSVDLEVLVEVHDEAELRRALDLGPTLIGVNQRDLHTFSVDTKRAERVLGSIPDEVLAVAESGIASPDDAKDLATKGFDAILVGEALVRGGGPSETVREWNQAGTEERNTDGVR